MMTELHRHIPDSPDRWEEYASILRDQRQPVMRRERVADVLPRIDAAINRRARRMRVIRYVSAPLFSLAAVIVIVLSGTLSNRFGAADQRPESQSAPPVAGAPTHLPRRMPRPHIDPSAMPNAEVPAQIDSFTPLVRVAPATPEGDQIGPGPSVAQNDTRINPTESTPIP
ncbi:MAG TPA: hypothetical protein VHI13_07905 [Candidatus Kapabacteria bacterium]|nr:hypothetical protein [Candidatus Kapabacteria bacterium]